VVSVVAAAAAMVAAVAIIEVVMIAAVTVVAAGTVLLTCVELLSHQVEIFVQLIEQQLYYLQCSAVQCSTVRYGVERDRGVRAGEM
jgi:hypothetical protein